MSFTGDWVYWLAGLGVIGGIAALVYLAWWALFSDRSRGRRRCPRCWYNMAYSPGMVCAECGFTALDEAMLHTTRRRYRLAAGAILGSVAIAIAINERVTQRGTLSILPTRALLWMLPLTSNAHGSIFSEIYNRAMFGELSGSQWSALITRCAGGDWRAAPASDAWAKKYGDFIAMIHSSMPNDPALTAPLMNIPPRLDLNTRAIWPQGMPVVVNVQMADWWPVAMECRIRATPRLSGARPVTFHRSEEARSQYSAYALSLPPLDESVRQITVDFQIERRRAPTGGAAPADDEASWEALGAQSLTVAARAQGTLEQLAAPVDDPVLSNTVMQAFRSGVVKWAAGLSPVRFSIDTSAIFMPAFDDTALGASVELVRDDNAVARRLNIWCMGGTASASSAAPPERNYGFEIDFEDVELLRQVSADDGRWQLRVSGDAALALRAGMAIKYWAGQFTLPLTLQHRNGQAPPRPWWTETETQEQ